jgi:hypothetical protein
MDENGDYYIKFNKSNMKNNYFMISQSYAKYKNVDLIVIQSEMGRQKFDKRVLSYRPNKEGLLYCCDYR